MMEKINNGTVHAFGTRLRDWLLVGVSLCAFINSNLVAAPIDLSSVTDIPAAVTLGEGDGSLTIKDGVMTLKGNPTKAAKYVENWTLNAVVFDYKFPQAIDLPPGTNRLGYSYHRQDKSGMTYLRALISDSRGGTWAVGTKLGMRWSRTELENNFQYTESYSFDVSEVGRIDPWVMMSLDPKQHDEYDAPQPPFKWIGWRVVSDKLNGEPFNVEVKDVEASMADQTANPYWILAPERLWSLRQGAPGAYYRGNWGCGKGNSAPKLSAGDLGVRAGQYRVSWELLGLDDWTVIQSGTQNAAVADSSASVVQLPLLDAGTYNLRLTMWKDGANKPQEFFLNYTVVRNSQKADQGNRASAKKPLEWESKGAPVFVKGSKAKITLRCNEVAKFAPGTVIQYTISSADSQQLKSGESPADKPIEIDLSEWSSGEPSLLLCARLVAGEEEIDVSRRVVGFASKTDIPKAASEISSSENKMTKALKGQIYRSKGDWSEGTSPIAAQFVKALETLKPWLDEAKETGYNVVELPAPWGDLNPLPKVYQFKYLDAMIAEAKRRGLVVTLRIAPANLPPWVAKEFMQDQNGFAHGLWSGQNNLIISPSGEQMRESLFAYLRELSGHYRNEPAVVGYCFSSMFFDHDLLDEPWLGQFVDYSEASQARFWKFLQERYDGNIGKLNQAYKTNYVQWTEIPMPRPKVVTDESGRLRPRTEAAWKDWSDHKISSIKSLRMGAIDAVREGDPDCWAGLYYSGTVPYYLNDIKARKSGSFSSLQGVRPEKEGGSGSLRVV